ncbi:MAG: response regulator [Campylobacterota bacterium]
MEDMKNDKPIVLIVDDMQENLMFLSDMLQDDYQIKIAKNGKKALDIIAKGDIDLILLDIVMPKLDGYEVCTVLQNDSKTKQIPIIFVTANTSAKDEQKGFELGAVDYITKPFNPITVKSRVKTHLSFSLQTKQLQEELEKSRQKDVLLQQQARLAALGEMIGNIAHQWRQPLSVITTTMSGLKLKNDCGMIQDGDIENTNDVILQSADFLSKTIDNFRNFFQKDQPNKKFLINDAILDTVDILKATYKNNHIDLKLDLQEDINYFGSKNLLSQVILNLLSNAKDAFLNLENIDNRKVLISLKIVDEDIIINVLDNANGVPSDIKLKVFDPYFTTKHKSQGTGLGLYMSRVILQNHFDGTLDVSNKQDKLYKGACFTVYIKAQNKSELEYEKVV